MPASEALTCLSCSSPFLVANEEVTFLRRMDLPLPNLCPDDRACRRMAWATFRALHRRRCDGTGKPILSMYVPDAKHPVYHTDYWWSDSWDPLSYGLDFDFGRPFFEQFDDLLRAVPVMHQSVIFSENCEYINMAGHCRNCYLSFYLDYCEDCLYIQDGNGNRNCVDCLGVNRSELCYECVDCTDCYAVLYSQRAVNCRESYLLTDCRACSRCIGCVNLVNKEYYVSNERVTPAEFERLRAALANRRTLEDEGERALALVRAHPRKYYFGFMNESSTGDNLRNTRSSKRCFHCHELENVSYADYFFRTHNSMDVTIYGNQSEWLYNCLKTGDHCSNDICCACCWTGSSYNAYCHLVISTKHCFGCSGLRQKEYCIFNKSYTRHDYEKLRERIVAHMRETGEWGMFFPTQMSPFPYNESVAQEYFPLTKGEALQRGLQWRDSAEESGVHPAAAIPGSALPDTIGGVDAGILEEILLSSGNGRPYRIIKAELDFYRKMEIPLPQLLPEERHARRFAQRNPRQLWARTCAECMCPLESSYDPKLSDRVLCESCYLAAVS